ncbi:polysaccharide pyruvyl transferase CsaB [Gudongella sp. DL1XJH-153]|uniref:polysaccharide pyruvyl transferase CsaB n=1 Tax=Gudongella sp. DL1XJH-153 TaxID=3409804 RepID=UPI003BB679B6
MKVLHLISGGDTGGAKTHIIALLKGLNKRIDAEIICFIEDTFYDDVVKAGIPIKVFKQKSRSDLTIISRLVEEIEDKGYDIIHCHGARANFIAQFLKGKVDKPFITTIHSDYKLDFKDNFYKRLVYTTLNTIALRRFDYYIGVSDLFRKMLVERGFRRDRIFVTYNGIDCDSQEDFVSKDEFLKRYNIEDRGQAFVGIAARLDKVKDHVTFIEAAKLVLEEEDATFLIAGEGAESDYLHELVRRYGIQDKVKFLGHVKDPYSFFNAIHINALTSVSESFPYVILEGAKMKKPVVTTEVGGVHMLVKNGENGYLVPVGNEVVLRDKLLKLIRDDELAEEMGRKLFMAVRRNFSYAAMAESHVKIYEKILHGGPNVVMSGYFGFDNSGDDAILKAIVKDMKEHNSLVRINVLSKDPDKTEGICPVVSSDRFKIRDVYKSLRDSDILISGGGSLLQDVTSTRSLLYYLALMKLALFLKKPVMVYANGIGPINKPFNRYLTKNTLNKVQQITLRDRGSMEYIQKMGVANKNVKVTADPVFTLEAADNNRINQIFVNEDIYPKKPLVGVSVRYWKDDKNLSRELSNGLKAIMDENDIEILLIPMHYPEDLEICQKIKEMVGKEDCHILQAKYTAEEIMGIIGKLKMMVAMRLHSLIYAATRKVPMMGLIYDPKVEGLLRELEIPYSISVDNLEAEKFKEVFDLAWNDLDNMRENIGEKEERLKMLAHENVEIAFRITGR